MANLSVFLCASPHNQQPDLQLAFVGCRFRMKMKRRPGLIIMYMSVPITAVLCLNVMVYCVPVQSQSCLL